MRGRPQTGEEQARPREQLVIVDVAQIQALSDEAALLVPVARVPGVNGQQKQRVDRRGDGPAAAAVRRDTQERVPAAPEAIEVGRADGDSDDVARVGCGREPGRGFVEPGERRQRRAGGITEGVSQQGQNLWRGGCELAECKVERRPQLRSATPEADQQQGVERLDQRFVVGVVGRPEHCDGAGQEPVRRVQVGVRVEQVARCGHRLGQPRFGLGVAGSLKQPWHGAQIAGGTRAEVGSLGQPAPSVGAERAEVGGAQESGDSPDGVAAGAGALRGRLEEGGYLLVRAEGGLGQVPRAALRPVGQGSRQLPVCVAALTTGGRLDDRRAAQGVTERQPPVLDQHDPASLGGGQCGQLGVPHGSFQEAELAGSVQRGQQQ